MDRRPNSCQGGEDGLRQKQCPTMVTIPSPAQLLLSACPHCPGITGQTHFITVTGHRVNNTTGALAKVECNLKPPAVQRKCTISVIKPSQPPSLFFAVAGFLPDLVFQ